MSYYAAGHGPAIVCRAMGRYNDGISIAYAEYASPHLETREEAEALARELNRRNYGEVVVEGYRTRRGT